MTGGVMIAFELLSAVFTMVLSHLVQTYYGGVGAMFLLFFGVAIRARNSTCASVAAVLFALLMIQA
jgi:hypothetical protein